MRSGQDDVRTAVVRIQSELRPQVCRLTLDTSEYRTCGAAGQ